MKVRNILGNRYSGTIGKDLVAVEGPTTSYLRAYRKPSNPNSELQQVQRGHHRKAVAMWRDLGIAQQAFYRKLEPPRVGYHVFMGRAMDALVQGKAPEVPVRMRYSTEDGQGIDHAWLVVRGRGRLLFELRLTRLPVEIALTDSDAPYTIVLCRGFREERVTTLDHVSPETIPPVLESPTLGIRLVAASPPRSASPPAAAEAPPPPE
jgi:hypothetical protein